MSYAFFEKLQETYPQAKIEVIVKKGLEDLLQFYPVSKVHSFSKKESGSALGLMNFGRSLSKETPKGYDLYFSLPDSFSAALIGRFVNAKKRVGFQREMRSGMLSDHYPIPYHLHYVKRYASLLGNFVEKEFDNLHTLFPQKEVAFSEKLKTALKKVETNFFESNQPLILFNPMAVAVSRTLSIEKSVAIFKHLQEQTELNFVLTGIGAAVDCVKELKTQLNHPKNLLDLTGKTTLLDLVAIMRTCQAVLTVDSGPAHLANALGRPTVVLLGAGDPELIRPWNEKGRVEVRKLGLACSPCRQNTCKLGTVECLEDLEIAQIGEGVLRFL